jgi:hypothetical protein
LSLIGHRVLQMLGGEVWHLHGALA